MLRALITKVAELLLGHRVVDRALDWKQAHDKATASRAEIDRIIRESENDRDSGRS